MENRLEHKVALTMRWLFREMRHKMKDMPKLNNQVAKKDIYATVILLPNTEEVALAFDCENTLN